ncbi:unnamed protein product [Adineta steineri]|uniref:Uncharacterized protein n=1 Tax=Adineta steineri TaxID=433720 RepID=A0A814E0B3_9BILA|nr:unnamed protein product [Adineta steineri]CAF0962523.1 unnamed protein product [Adineta steineri]
MESERIQRNKIQNQQDEKDDSGIEQDNSFIYIRISVEDLHLQKVLKFNLDDTVWCAKQKVLQVLIRELTDSLNFGLYLPPCNGRAGKFLDESRCLREYPLSGPVSYLEFKYKRRVYKAIHLVQKNINLKINVKKFIESVRTNQISKVSRYLEKGFDPNFHISDDETPLSSACIDLLEPRSMIMTLVNGGAHLDFRIRNGGLTPLHQSAIYNRKEAIVTLLELGASPNIYDEKMLTPLYHSIINKQVETNIDSSYCCLLLLQDHSIVNCHDESLSTELHQACRLGLVQHIEHLLFYRADINAINIGGNTPLHICAATNQEACARVLLFRGADINIVNKTNKTAYELALVSQNHSIASLIETHKSEHVVPFRDTPLINPKRRSIYIEQQRNKHRARSSSNTTPLSSSSTNRSQSMPKFNSNNSTRRSQSPITTPTIEHYFQQQHPSSRSSSPKSFSVNSDHGFGSECASHLSSSSPNAPNGSYTYKRKRLYAAAPGRKCMCIKSYRTNLPGELLLKKGDIVEILSVGEQGYLEGKCKDIEGWFPSNHVQDICVFKNGEMINDDTIVISRDALSALMINNDAYSPRTIVLQRGKKGFGFVLRGSRVAGKLFQPSPSFPALQFLDSIEKGSNADKAGLKQNDYVLEINDINVISMPHEECVNLIKRAGDTLALKVITANTSHYQQLDSPTIQNNNNNCSQSLPYRRKAPLRPGLEQQFNEDLDRALCEYDYGSISVPSSNNCEDYISMSKQVNENLSNGGNNSIYIKNKPLVPERDSSLYECFPSSQNPQGYNTLRSLNRGSPSTTSVPILSTTNVRCNSNSSSNEADEESSLSSMNSNHVLPTTEENNSTIYMNPLSLNSTNMSTFKTINTNILPSKPSDIKKRSNNRKQIYATLNSNNSNNNTTSSIILENEVTSTAPPPPPPFPTTFDSSNEPIRLIPIKSEPIKTLTSDFQTQIEQAKTRLKKIQSESSSSPKKTTMIKSSHQENSNKTRLPSSYYAGELKNIVIEDITPSNGFPPPPSPTTLHRSSPPNVTLSSSSSSSSSSQRNSTLMDPRLDTNFSAVIAQRAAEAKARRHENPSTLEFSSNGLPPSTTFFNNCVTTNGVPQNLTSNGSSCPQRFSATANQLLENLKRRGGSTSSIGSLVKHYNQQQST